MKIAPLLMCISACTIASDQSVNSILQAGDPVFLYTAEPAAEVFDGKVYVCCLHDQPAARGFKCDRE